jgi:hypothetical protein
VLLAPTLKAVSLDTKITFWDATGWKSQARILVRIQAAGADNLLSVVSSHGHSSPLNGKSNTTLPIW